MTAKLIVWGVAFAFVAACGTGTNGDGTSNSGNNGDPADMRCEEMNSAIASGEGAACGGGSDCESIPCACDDGSIINTSSCFNGQCEGLSACESACGTVLACEDGGGENNGANNGADPFCAGTFNCFELSRDSALCGSTAGCSVQTSAGCTLDPSLPPCNNLDPGECVTAFHCAYSSESSTCFLQILCDGESEALCTGESRYCHWGDYCDGGDVTCEATTQADCDAYGDRCSWFE